MTRQEIFDTVVTHLFTQGVQSASVSGDRCFYRGPNGTMCAVGCLIPDEEYEEDFEMRTVLSLYMFLRNTGKAEKTREILGENEYLLADLQQVHDETGNWKTSGRMWRALRDVAEKNSVSAAILDTVSFTGR